MTEQFTSLSGAETEVLWCLFLYGPTWDGNIPSKTGRNNLYKQGLLDRNNGWQWLTNEGVMLAMDLGFHHKKDIIDNRLGVQK
jgi:hypothetical protein